MRILEVQNQPFLTNSEALNFDFHEFLHLLKAEIDKSNTIQTP